MYTRRFRFLGVGLLMVGAVSGIVGCGSGSDINRVNSSFATATPLSTATPLPTATPSPLPTASPTPSPAVARFAGVWSGPITLNTGQNGVTEITIAEDGSISGLAISLDEDFGFQEQGSANGNIDADGNTKITFTYERVSYGGGGVLSLNSTQDRLTGTLTQTVNGVVRGSVRAELQRGPLPRY